jgi:hypothetical protein
MREELTFSELEIQHAELLPERETLKFDFNWATVYASNAAVAFNVASFASSADADAWQSIDIDQH